MPRIPQITSQVSSTPAAQGRLTVRASEMGQSIGRGVQNAAATFGQIALDEKRKADSIAAMSADRQFGDLESALVYDPEGGALSKKGKDAFATIDTVLSEFDQKGSELIAALGNDDQKIAAKRMFDARRASVERTLQRHVAREREVFDQSETDAYLANSLEAAANNYTNPARIATELDRQEGAILAWAARNGVSSDVTKERLSGMTSKTHAAVIQRMLDGGAYKEAGEYLAANREDIQSDDAAAAEKLIRAQTLRGAAQDKADEILASTDSQREALKQARAIEDPEQRDEVVRRVNSRFAEQEAIEADERREVARAAFAVVEDSGSVDSIPVSVWDELDVDTKRALEIRSRQVRAGIEPVTDWDVYYDLKSQASDPTTAVAYTERNLLTYRHQLSDAEFKELVGIQNALKAGRGRSDKVLQGYRTANQIVNDALSSVGIDSSPKEGSDDAKRVNQFRRRVDEEIVAYQTLTGKEATTDEIQRIVDQLMLKGSVPGAVWGDAWRTDKFAFEVQPGESFEITDIDEVPQAERSKIEEALRRRNMPVTESAILSLFNAKVAQ